MKSTDWRGYLDCTEWVVFPTLEECRKFIEGSWEEDQDV